MLAGAVAYVSLDSMSGLGGNLIFGVRPSGFERNIQLEELFESKNAWCSFIKVTIESQIRASICSESGLQSLFLILTFTPVLVGLTEASAVANC